MKTYDALNRLISAQNSGTDCSVAVLGGKTKFWGNSYGYDPWGNLLQKSVTKCSAESLVLTAASNNQLVGYGYDAAGNMTHDATANLNYSYDQENRITGAAGYTYTYDSDGNRVEKSNGTTGTLYWSMSPGIVAESDLTGAIQSEYVFFDGERVARRDGVNGAGGVFYYFSDHLKTASVITDSTGNIKAESDYYPWGGEVRFVNNDPNHYKFTGKERDLETGLDYFGARYYSNGLGRWTTPDKPLADQHRLDPQSWNIYAYARNNPLRYIDDNGLEVIESKDVKYYTVKGKTAQQAVDNARNHFGKNEAGRTSFRMQVVNVEQKATATPSSPPKVGFDGKAVLTKADVQLDQTVELPKWHSDNPSEQAAFDHVVDILQKHENDHVQINHEEADKLDKSLPGTTGTGEGQTGQEAAQNAYNDMFDKTSQKQHEAKAEADKRGDDLDKKTNHGTKDQQ